MKRIRLACSSKEKQITNQISFGDAERVSFSAQQVAEGFGNAGLDSGIELAGVQGHLGDLHQSDRLGRGVRDHVLQRHQTAGKVTHVFHEVKRDAVLLPLADGRKSSAEVGSEGGRSPFFGFKPGIDIHDASLVVSKPLRQDFSKPSLFSIRLMNDATRRAAFVGWFNGSPCKGDREALIRKSGLTKGRISQLFDPNQQFGERAAASLADRLGLPADFFNAPAETASNVAQASMGGTMIPIISSVQAGAWCGVEELQHAGADGEGLRTDYPVSKSAFALEIKGISMQPEFQPGDHVIIDPTVEPLPGDFVVARNGDEEATFKKYRPRGANESGEQVFELVALNEDYPSMRSDVTPMRVVGTMVEHRKYRRR